MKFPCCLIPLLLILVTSCSPTQQIIEPTSTSTQPPQPTPTEIPSSTPTPTATVTATAIPSPTPTATPQVPDIILQMQKDEVPGIEIVDGNKVNIRIKEEKKDDNGNVVKPAEYLPGGAMSFKDAEKRIKENDGTYIVEQIYGRNYALYNPEDQTEKFGGKWIKKEDVVWDMKWVPVPNYYALSKERQQEYVKEFCEGFIELNTWEEFFNATDYEKYFMDNFPGNTYWPDKDKIVTNYDENTNIDPVGEFNWSTPFGNVDLSRSPFDNSANHFVLMPNPNEGRNYFTGIMTVKVFNPSDKNEEENFGVLHYGFASDNRIDAAGSTMGPTAYGNELLLPGYAVPGDLMNRIPWLRAGRDFYRTFDEQYDFLDQNDNLTGMHKFVLNWINEGRVPMDMEEFIMIYDRRTLSP